jgi:hypothetical protein
MAHHTNLLTVAEYFKSSSQINTAPVPTVLSTDIPITIQPSFIGKKYEFWVKQTVVYCLHKSVKKT